MTQDIATRSVGMMLGMIAVSSKSRLKGALVLMVIQDKTKARTTDRPDAPMPKINEFKTTVYVAGSA